MPTPLIINGTIFDYPVTNDPPGWGEEATGWAEAVTETLNGIITPVDIPITTATINNNQASFINIPGLIFNNTIVRGANIEYTIFRRTDSSSVAEEGTIKLSTDGASWTLIRGMATFDAGVVLDITPAGQFQYKSNNMSGTNYSGTIKFKATVLIQT